LSSNYFITSASSYFFLTAFLKAEVRLFKGNGGLSDVVPIDGISTFLELLFLFVPTVSF